MEIMLHLIVSLPGTQPGKVLGRNYPALSWGQIFTVLEKSIYHTALTLHEACCGQCGRCEQPVAKSPPFTLSAAL